MTVSYNYEAGTTNLMTFARLLFRWKTSSGNSFQASLYKLVYQELLIFLAGYYAISFVYRFALTPDQRIMFEDVAVFFEKNAQNIPLTFVLGFYVSMVCSRWWEQYKTWAWPDRFSLHVATLLEGDDQRCLLLRRTLVRYVNLSSILCLRDISIAVKKRFPSLEHLVKAGLMTDEEVQMYKDVELEKHTKHWIPLQWASTLIMKCRKEDYIKNDSWMYNLLKELFDYRQNLFMLASFDWISIPLVYTQVVTLSTYVYFFTCLIARQYLDPSSKHANTNGGFNIDLYFPVFTAVQFVFYIGWLKVAETLLNPLGEDDDDFEVNYIIERNLAISFCQVTENYNKIPSLEQDPHLGETELDIPHTEESLGVKDTGFSGSVAQVDTQKNTSKASPADEGLMRPSSVISSHHGGPRGHQVGSGTTPTGITPQVSCEPPQPSLKLDGVLQDPGIGGNFDGEKPPSKSPALSRPGSRLSVGKLLRSFSRQVSTGSTSSSATILGGASSSSSIAEELKPLAPVGKSASKKGPRKQQLQAQDSVNEVELGFIDAASSSIPALISTTNESKQALLLDTIAEKQETDESQHSRDSCTPPSVHEKL